MTDLYGLARQELAQKTSRLLDVPIAEAYIDCVCAEYPARSAAPLIFGADAAAWAGILQNGMDGYTLLGVPLVRAVEHNGGHLLFRFTDAFYTAALRTLLDELPRVDDPAMDIPDHDAALSRLGYTLRRMWMLSRHAKGEAACPQNPAVQRALYLTLGIAGRLTHPRGLRHRMLEASDALLCMTRSVLPRQRPALCRDCGHVGDVAGRAFTLGLRTLCEQASLDCAGRNHT